MDRRDGLVAGLLGVALVAWLLPVANYGVDPHHDGIMLKPALDVLSGQVLFRDTFTQYGALTTYLQVAALWVHPSLLSLRVLAIAAYAGALLFLYAAWRLILPRSLAALSCGLFLLFIPSYEKNWLGEYWLMLPWSSVFALMLQGVGLYALFRVIRDEQAAQWGLVLGMACAGTFWCRQPVGVIMTGCVGASWLTLQWAGWTPANTPRQSILRCMLAGFLSINALLLGYILLTGALPEWWYQNFVWPSKWAQSSESVSRNLFLTFLVHPRAGASLLILLLGASAPALAQRHGLTVTPRRLALYYLGLGGVLVWQHQWVFNTVALRDGGWSALFPMIVLVQALASLAAVFQRPSTPRTTEYYLVAALAAVALGSLLQYYPVPDPWHVVWSLAPGFGLIVFVLWRCSRWPAPVLALVLLAAFLPAFRAKIQSARQMLDQPMTTLTEPAALRGMRVTPTQARSLHQIMKLLALIQRQQPNAPSALIGNDALFLCLTENHANPSPYYVTWVNLASPAENQRRWNYIEHTRPVMFLHKARWDAVNDFYHRARYLPLLYLSDDALEIAVPQELAAALGLGAYGAPVKPEAKP